MTELHPMESIASSKTFESINFLESSRETTQNDSLIRGALSTKWKQCRPMRFYIRNIRMASRSLLVVIFRITFCWSLAVHSRMSMSMLIHVKGSWFQFYFGVQRDTTRHDTTMPWCKHIKNTHRRRPTDAQMLLLASFFLIYSIRICVNI